MGKRISAKQQKRTAWIVSLTILFACLFLLLLSRYLSARGLAVSWYTLTSDKLDQTVRMVHLTDLHNSEFGAGNRRLIEKVSEQEPDLIVITGDLLDQNEARTDVAETLIRGLCPIAPVYISFGNHEAAVISQYGLDLRTLYTDAGANVLEYDWQDVTVNGQHIRLGGIYGYCLPAKYLSTGEARKPECDFLTAFQDTDDLRVLLCHMPVCWIINGGLDAWDADLVLSGHAHGGQIRIPFIGGLWAPDQGWFPGKESGLYFSSDGERVMLLSRGLGSTERIPRLNNIPEIVVLDLIPKS